MAKLCPITNTRVVYLDCLECDEKICMNQNLKVKENTYDDSARNGSGPDRGPEEMP